MLSGDQELKVIGVGFHIYNNVYMLVDQNILNRTLATDSPSKIFTVGLIGKYRHYSKLTLELALKVRALLLPFADQTTSRIVADWEECECEELHLRRGSPLACG